MNNFEIFVAQTLEFAKEVGDDMKMLAAKNTPVPVSDTFTYTAGAQLFKMVYEGKVTDVYRNGIRMHPSQYDALWKSVEITDTLSAGDYIQIDYLVNPDISNIYGIEWDDTISAPEVTKIGNPALHVSLPIQSQMKRCLVTDDGNINYFLGENDSAKKADGITPAVKDGTDGQTMVRVIEHWEKWSISGTTNRRLWSTTPFPGATRVPEFFFGAYKASIDRTNNKLASVVNTTPQFRGGNNQAAWDLENEYKSQLGKPCTYQNRTDFRALATARGDGWEDRMLQKAERIAWLMTCEFGTRYHQDAISQGATNVNGGDWLDFNSRFPLFRCGSTDSLGNATGEIPVTLQDFPIAGQSTQTQVFSYRGIENFYGDLWEWTNGVNILIENGIATAYMSEGKNMNSTNVDGYKPVGQLAASNGYIDAMIPGTILPKSTNGASSATYYTDYFYLGANGLRGLICSGAAYNGAHAGSFFVYSSRVPASRAANIGSRLCFQKR